MPFQTATVGGGGGYSGYGAAGMGFSPVSATPFNMNAVPGVSASGEYANQDMMNIYNQLLGMNVQNYNNLLAGYASSQSNLQSQLAGASRGYGELYNGIVGTLGLGGSGWGVATPAANAIEEQFARSRGDIMQGMIGSGLGNSTVAASLQNQNALQASRAYGELGNHLANTAAGYAAQIGLAQQQANLQGIGMQSQMANNYLNTLGGYRFANTAGNILGRYSISAEGSRGGGGGGGGGSRGGGGSGYSGMQDAFGWADNLIGRNNYVGYSPAYQDGGYYGGYGGESVQNFGDVGGIDFSAMGGYESQLGSYY